MTSRSRGPWLVQVLVLLVPIWRVAGQLNASTTPWPTTLVSDYAPTDYPTSVATPAQAETDMTPAANSPFPASIAVLSSVASLEADSDEVPVQSGRRTVTSVLLSTPPKDDLLDALYKMRSTESLELDSHSQDDILTDASVESSASKENTRKRKKRRRRKKRRKHKVTNPLLFSRSMEIEMPSFEAIVTTDASSTENSSEVSSEKLLKEPDEAVDSLEDFNASSERVRGHTNNKSAESASLEPAAAEPTVDIARVMDQHIRQHFSRLQGASREEADQRSEETNGHAALGSEDHAPLQDHDAAVDMHPAASGHSHKSKHEKGGGHKHQAESHKKKGKKKKKGYKEKHIYKKLEKGHHDKEGHKKKYKDEKGKKEKHEEGAGHFGEHKKGEKGKKGAKYNEEGHHKKGHSTKGEHNVHKKDEYHKKHEFYDEHHEGGEHEKHGGFHGSHKKGKGKKYKKGHHESEHNSKHKGKKGKHKKGKSHKSHKKHKDAGGHDEKYNHKKKYHKQAGMEKGKKWGFKKAGKSR